MFKIQRDNYEAAEQFLLKHSCSGFRNFKDETDVATFVDELLTSLESNEGSSVSCGGLLVMVDEDDYVSLYVEPKRWFRANQFKARKCSTFFELV